MKGKNIVHVDGKNYQKTLQFGNRSLKIVAKSRVVYSRKAKHKNNINWT